MGGQGPATTVDRVRFRRDFAWISLVIGGGALVGLGYLLQRLASHPNGTYNLQKSLLEVGLALAANCVTVPALYLLARLLERSRLDPTSEYIDSIASEIASRSQSNQTFSFGSEPIADMFVPGQAVYCVALFLDLSLLQPGVSQHITAFFRDPESRLYLALPDVTEAAVLDRLASRTPHMLARHNGNVDLTKELVARKVKDTEAILRQCVSTASAAPSSLTVVELKELAPYFVLMTGDEALFSPNEYCVDPNARAPTNRVNLRLDEAFRRFLASEMQMMFGKS